LFIVDLLKTLLIHLGDYSRRVPPDIIDTQQASPKRITLPISETNDSVPARFFGFCGHYLLERVE